MKLKHSFPGFISRESMPAHSPPGNAPAAPIFIK